MHASPAPIRSLLASHIARATLHPLPQSSSVHNPSCDRHHCRSHYTKDSEKAQSEGGTSPAYLSFLRSDGGGPAASSSSIKTISSSESSDPLRAGHGGRVSDRCCTEKIVVTVCSPGV